MAGRPKNTSVRGKATAATMLAALCGALVFAACTASESPAPRPSPSVSLTPTAVPSVPATATPVPDPFGAPPATGREALERLEPLLGAQAPPGCYAPLRNAWAATCLEGDVDGDGVVDAVYLVPLQGGAGLSPAPAVVIVDASVRPSLASFPATADADASPLGAGLFSVADRNGAGGPDVAFAVTRCGASNCSSTVDVLSWDGTAWRNIGPANVQFDNPESIAFSGQGAASELIVRAGTLGSVGAGPTRATTSTFRLKAGVFTLHEAVPDRPEYLFHAVLDADGLFAAGRFRDAIAAYERLLGDASLQDWREELGERPGRPALESYARFRIAVATAATGADPVEAIDRVITGAGDTLFVEGIQAFRRGFQEAGSVSRGCQEATRYFSTPLAARLLGERFDYGYGNPRKQPVDVCPL